MKRHSWILCLLLPLTVALAGCWQQSSDDLRDAALPAAASSGLPPDGDGSRYLLPDEPVGAQSVIAARQSAQDGEPVVVVGRIGGSEHPWVEGRAAFSLVDASLKACSDIPGDPCPTPWDYCCETHNLPSSTAMVKLVDDQGDVVRADARSLLDVSGLSTVVVRGTAVRDEAGNLTILADGVYVRS
jgi:hypothetical protein